MAEWIVIETEYGHRFALHTTMLSGFYDGVELLDDDGNVCVDLDNDQFVVITDEPLAEAEAMALVEEVPFPVLAP